MAEPQEPTAVIPYRESSVELGTIRASSPAELVRQATEVANALASVITDRKLFSTISGRRFVRCEGWTTLAVMMGVLPREQEVVKLEDGGYSAAVELVRMSDGAVLTRASAECGMDEKTWASRDAYARRSMAITRATSKACRIAFSWIMVLSGYEATPAEEIPHEPEPESRPATITLETIVPFGKRKGQTVAAVGRSYFAFLKDRLDADDNPHQPTLTFVQDALRLFPSGDALTDKPKAIAATEAEDAELDKRLAREV